MLRAKSEVSWLICSRASILQFLYFLPHAPLPLYCYKKLHSKSLLGLTLILEKFKQVRKDSPLYLISLDKDTKTCRLLVKA